MSSINLDQITSDQYAQAYLDYLFSDKGPVAALENYFIEASGNLRTLRSPLGCQNKTGVTNGAEQSDGVQRVDTGKDDERGGRLQKAEECEQSGESLKVSIVETEPRESLDHKLHDAAST